MGVQEQCETGHKYGVNLVMALKFSLYNADIPYILNQLAVLLMTHGHLFHNRLNIIKKYNEYLLVQPFSRRC